MSHYSVNDKKATDSRHANASAVLGVSHMARRLQAVTAQPWSHFHSVVPLSLNLMFLRLCVRTRQSGQGAVGDNDKIFEKKDKVSERNKNCSLSSHLLYFRPVLRSTSHQMDGIQIRTCNAHLCFVKPRKIAIGL